MQTIGETDAHLHATISAPVGALYAAAGRRPTIVDYDLASSSNVSSLALSPCDVTKPTEWFVGVHLGAEAAGVPETLFSISFESVAALAPVGSTVAGRSCCGGFSYWRCACR